MTHKISVIIPVYNSQKTIINTLTSIKNQSLKNIEVLIVNDGSEDASHELCASFVKNDCRFRYFYQSNQGVSAARNFGIKKATGEYLCFVDSDDILPKDSLNTLLELQLKNINSFVVGSFVLKKSLKRYKNFYYQNDTYSKNDLSNFVNAVNNINTAPWGKLFNLSIIREKNILFPLEIPYGEDAIFLYTYLKNIYLISTFKEIVYEYKFDNIKSAGRRFYENYSKYLFLQCKAKLQLFKEIGAEEYIDESAYFFNCLDHYITFEKRKDLCIKRVKESAELFSNCIKGSVYENYIKNEEYEKLIVYWKKKHFLSFTLKRIKVLINKIIYH